MLIFNPVTIKDKEIITTYTRSGDFLNCDFAFSNMCSWRFLYDSKFAIDDGFLFIRFFLGKIGNQRHAYMFPIGTGDLRQAIEKIEKDAEENNNPLRILGITPEGKAKLETLMPDKFTFTAERN
jgi:hypothetical protein